MAASIVISLAALIYANSRVTDAEETLRAGMSLGLKRVLSKIDALDARLSGQIQALDTKLSGQLQVHELEHHRK